jgi:hypothetical protein
MDKWDQLKITMAAMNEYVYSGFMFPRNLLHKFIKIRNDIMEEDDFESPYCSTCGSCGKDCCPPSTCKYGVNYINNLRKELACTRKALGTYIGMMGFNVTEEIIDQEINFHGHREE